jgi:Na+-driven multidrug efflux pump
MVWSRFEAEFGALPMAAGKLGASMESFTWLVGGGFGSGLISFIGQNYGAGKADRVLRGTRVSAALMAGWGVFSTLFLIFGSPLLFYLFVPVPEMAYLGGWYGKIYCACQFPMCLEAVWSGIFKGTGRTVPPAVVSITCNCLKPAFGLALMGVAENAGIYGLFGLWAGVCAADVLRGAWLFVWFLAARRTLLPHRSTQL